MTDREFCRIDTAYIFIIFHFLFGVKSGLFINKSSNFLIKHIPLRRGCFHAGRGFLYVWISGAIIPIDTCLRLNQLPACSVCISSNYLTLNTGTDIMVTHRSVYGKAITVNKLIAVPWSVRPIRPYLVPIGLHVSFSGLKNNFSHAI